MAQCRLMYKCGDINALRDSQKRNRSQTQVGTKQRTSAGPEKAHGPAPDIETHAS